LSHGAILRRALPAAVIGLLASLAATAVVAFAGAGLTALEWSAYDRGIRARERAPVSPALVVVARDAASEARFGTGPWDRALLARLIAGLSRAGAAVVGVGVPLGQPSVPGRGGAGSDALLSQATAAADNVVYSITLELAHASVRDGVSAAHRSWLPSSRTPLALPEALPLGASLPGLAQHARAVGHTLAPPDPDGVVRKVPLFVRLDDMAVPSFGLALAMVFIDTRPDQVVVDRRGVVIPRPGSGLAQVRIPVDDRGRALVGYVAPERLTVVPFLDMWTAIDASQAQTLRGLVEDKIVLVLAEPARGLQRTSVGPMSDVLIQAQLLNAVLAGSWLREAPLEWALPATLVLASLAAWLGLVLRWWTALVGVAVLASGYVVALLLSPPLIGIVLPAVPPLAAGVVAGAGALLWNQLGSAHRLRDLEGQLEAIREALVRQESTVEALEEDLEAARAAVARSTGAERELLRAADGLRVQLVEARAQEEQTRGRLADLERELRAADPRQAQLDDAEQERLRQRCAEVAIITREPAMLARFRDLEKAARSSLPILITGEPGTGKELFARAAHRLSPRAGGPFVAVNMAAIPPELFESELFGHVKGSFTGAVAERKGYFEQADRGTIFLDEIGELAAPHQSKLLRVLQDKTFHRVGATRSTAVDVRVVAASNRDLERGIAEGWFREDLYFRLKGLVLRLPPLRERSQDVALLAARFLEEAAAEASRRVTLSEAALRALERHDWPGNVRELQHCLRQAVALADRAVLVPEDLRLAPAADARADTADDAEVLVCLRQHGFDMQATARALQWDRSTVTQRLKGLGFRALVEAGGDRRKAALELAGDPALGRAVELKLSEYHEHLLRAVEGFDSVEAAVAACRRRFKNLPERHFRSLEFLVRQRFERQSPTARV
jgi:DNA-binding NtrC family response regulator/CHASE2 domain-containing sensor protein